MSTYITSVSAAAALVFAAACCAYLCRRERVGVHLLWCGWVLGLLLFAGNALLAGAPPFGNMRQVLCFFPTALGVVWWLQVRMGGNRISGAALSFVAAAALAGALSMPADTEWRRLPALQSPWFVPHVTSYVVAYGLLTIAALSAAGAVGEHRASRMAGADTAARLAFPFLTFGLCSGALWADAAWGRYWAWDIKEVWSLVTWLIYLLYFHGGGGRRALLLLGFAAVLVTFFVVNFIPGTNSLHSYTR